MDEVYTIKKVVRINTHTDRWKHWELNEGSRRRDFEGIWVRVSQKHLTGIVCLSARCEHFKVGRSNQVGGRVIFSRGIVPEEAFEWCWRGAFTYRGPFHFRETLTFLLTGKPSLGKLVSMGGCAALTVLENKNSGLYASWQIPFVLYFFFFFRYWIDG